MFWLSIIWNYLEHRRPSVPRPNPYRKDSSPRQRSSSSTLTLCYVKQKLMKSHINCQSGLALDCKSKTCTCCPWSRGRHSPPCFQLWCPSLCKGCVRSTSCSPQLHNLWKLLLFRCRLFKECFLLTLYPTFTVSRHSVWHESSSCTVVLEPAMLSIGQKGPIRCTLSCKTELSALLLVLCWAWRVRYVTASIVNLLFYQTAWRKGFIRLCRKTRNKNNTLSWNGHRI